MTPHETTLNRLGVSRETYEHLAAYVALIEKWSPKINLISRASLNDIWQRHIVDSVQIATIHAQNPASWGDLGSGGGLPGIVAAILNPSTSTTLIESDLRKATFLRTCIHTLDLNAHAISERIETAPPLGADVISARALAPLPKLLGYVDRHLSPDGTAILPKGKNFEQELAEARKTWSFDCTLIPSITDPGATILRIEGIRRA